MIERRPEITYQSVLWYSSIPHLLRRFLVVVSATLLASSLAATAQADGVGPSGCVVASGTCGSGSSGGGGGYDPYAAMMPS